MPKSIIDVEVNTEQWDEYVTLFKKYQEAVARLPKEWSKVEDAAQGAAEATEDVADHAERAADATGGLGKKLDQAARGAGGMKGDFVAMAAAMLAMVDLMAQQARAEDREDRRDQQKRREEDQRQRKAAKARKDQVDASRKLREDARRVAVDTAKTTANVLKWAAVGGIGAVAGFVGSGFGLGSLAQDVSQTRRAALGIGVSSGEQRAFGLDMGRFVDPDFLGNIANAQADWSKRWVFNAMGVQSSGKDPADLAVEVLRRARDLFGHSDKSTQFAQAHGLLDAGFTMESLRRLQQPGELESQIKSFQKDRAGLGSSEADQRAFQDLMTQVKRSSVQIEQVFVRGLAPLTPELGQLSSVVAQLVISFGGSGGAKQLLNDMTQGVKRFTAYLESPAFGRDFKEFENDAGHWLATLKMLFQELEGITNSPFMKWFIRDKPDALDRADTAAGKFLAPAGKWLTDPDNWSPNPFKWNTPLRGHEGPIMGALSPLDWGRIGATEQTGSTFGLPMGLLSSIYGLESSSGRNPGMSPKGALGPFQLMPGTAAQYGVSDRTSFDQSVQGAARYLRDLMKEFQGDIGKAAAAYNWGQGNLENDIRMHGAHWQDFLPKETKAYVQSVTQGVSLAKASGGAGGPGGKGGAGGNVRVTVNNNTGGSAVVSVNQMAPQ